jgi:crooked neck
LDNCRSLYERLLSKTEHLKVWISFANFERSVEQTAAARKVFERAYSSLKQQRLVNERLLLLEAWKELETCCGLEEDAARVEKMFPKKIKKKRKIDSVDGTEEFEEFVDFVFPDEAAGEAPHSKLLELAHKWKREQEA